MKKKITAVEFAKAQKTIADFCSQDFKESHGEGRPCIKCNKRIHPIHSDTMRFPEGGMWLNGTVEKISSGYGSSHDGDMFIIALCDDCIDALKKENKIEFAGNYMGMYEEPEQKKEKNRLSVYESVIFELGNLKKEEKFYELVWSDLSDNESEYVSAVKKLKKEKYKIEVSDKTSGNHMTRGETTYTALIYKK